MKFAKKILLTVLVCTLSWPFPYLGVTKIAHARGTCYANISVLTSTTSKFYLNGELQPHDPYDQTTIYLDAENKDSQTYAIKVEPISQEYLSKTQSVTVSNWECGSLVTPPGTSVTISLDKNPNYTPPTPVQKPTGTPVGETNGVAKKDPNDPAKECASNISVKVSAYKNSSTIILSWDAPDKSAGVAQNYNVQRATDVDVQSENGFQEITRIYGNPPATTYTDTVANGHTYSYRIQTYISAGNKTCDSDHIAVNLTDPTKPTTEVFTVHGAASAGAGGDNCGCGSKLSWLTDPLCMVMCTFIQALIAIMNDTFKEWLLGAVQ